MMNDRSEYFLREQVMKTRRFGSKPFELHQHAHKLKTWRKKN